MPRSPVGRVPVDRMPGLMLRSEAIAPAPIIECSGVVIVAYSPSRGAQVARKASVAWRCIRCVALHPNRRGVMPTDRVHCCLCCGCCGGVLRSVVGHCSRWSAVWRLALDCALSRWSAVWPCACCVALHLNRRGVMPTDRVYCGLCCACCGGVLRSVVGHCSRWSAVWRLALDCALSRWSAVRPCACCGSLYLLCGAAPVVGRCTRYVALHPNRVASRIVV